MAKLVFEWARSGNEIIIRKARGKITFDEVVKLMNSRQYYDSFAGMLMVFQERIRGEEFLFDGFSAEDDEGDAVVLHMVDDDSECPVCGRNRLFPQYCPECGSARVEPVDDAPHVVPLDELITSAGVGYEENWLRGEDGEEDSFVLDECAWCKGGVVVNDSEIVSRAALERLYNRPYGLRVWSRKPSAEQREKTPWAG